MSATTLIGGKTPYLLWLNIFLGTLFIGMITQRLQSRLTEHVPRCVRTILTDPNPNRKTISVHKNAKVNSSIAEHLSDNAECLRNYSDDWFSILANKRNSYHLAVLEATYIMSYEPVLCKQQKFDYQLGMFSWTCVYTVSNRKHCSDCFSGFANFATSGRSLLMWQFYVLLCILEFSRFISTFYPWRVCTKTLGFLC